MLCEQGSDSPVGQGAACCFVGCASDGVGCAPSARVTIGYLLAHDHACGAVEAWATGWRREAGLQPSPRSHSLRGSLGSGAHLANGWVGVRWDAGCATRAFPRFRPAL